MTGVMATIDDGAWTAIEHNTRDLREGRPVDLRPRSGLNVRDPGGTGAGKPSHRLCTQWLCHGRILIADLTRTSVLPCADGYGLLKANIQV